MAVGDAALTAVLLAIAALALALIAMLLISLWRDWWRRCAWCKISMRNDQPLGYWEHKKTGRKDGVCFPCHTAHFAKYAKVAKSSHDFGDYIFRLP